MTAAPLYHRPTKSILLQVDDPFQVRELIPHSRTVQHTTFVQRFAHSLRCYCDTVEFGGSSVADCKLFGFIEDKT